jgi:excinuclease ABC subunit A
VGCEGLAVPAAFHDVITAEQAGLGFSVSSTVLSLTGLGEVLRKRFAATPQAKTLKLSAKHFSTATPGGRCETCEGRGVLTVPMDLLPDVTVGCEICLGRRFTPAVLACQLEGWTFSEVLDAPVVEVARRFSGDKALAAPMQALSDVGLGYLTLGQAGGALSEGERQRLRLARLRMDPGMERVAILLDEPTRGLGFEEVGHLAQVLHRLAAEGHLVVAVEHDLDFIRSCDWLIDLGPEGGESGGRIMVEGTPETVAGCLESYTGQALAEG